MFSSGISRKANDSVGFSPKWGREREGVMLEEAHTTTEAVSMNEQEI